MRCWAHILNLVVNDELKEIDNSIVAVRSAIRYVRSSPSRLSRFQNFVKNISKEEKALVYLDVQTRCNFTFLILDSALKYVYGFNLLEEEDEIYMQYFDKDKNGKSLIGPPTSKEWENCVLFSRFLKVVYEVTLKFSPYLFCHF